MTRGLEKAVMPSNLKKRVRARMKKTGETYEQALRHVRAHEKRNHAGEPGISGAPSAAASAEVGETRDVIHEPAAGAMTDRPEIPSIELRAVNGARNERAFEVDVRRALRLRIGLSLDEDPVDKDRWRCTLEAPDGEPWIDGTGDEPLTAFADARYRWEDLVEADGVPWNEIEALLDRDGAFDEPDGPWADHVRVQ